MMTHCIDGLTDHRVYGEQDRRVKPGKRIFLKGLLPALLIGVIAGFTSAANSSETNKRTDAPSSFQGALDDQKILWQNWDDAKRQEFWFTEQGSQIIPYYWALALEMPKGDKKFLGRRT